jgi:hypothetical protein
MRLTTTTKLLYQRKNNLFLVFVVLALFPFVGFSQNYKFHFKNAPVSEALLRVATKSDIRISFDASSMSEFSITKDIKSDSIENVLAEIIYGTGYQTLYKHDTWLIFKPDVEKQKVKYKRISGFVFDSKTGERLPYASVFISKNGQFVSATVDGVFSAKVKDVGNCLIFVKYLGYQPLDTIINLYEEKNPLRIGLSQKSQDIQTIDVTGKSLEMLEVLNDVGHTTINPKRFTDLPNYGETDVFRAIQLLPGISAQENSAELNIRGSSADQNLVTFDGFTLYNLDHFFGVFSAINPNVIKDIQVFRGGFDSRYGERVSGIVEITGKSGNKTKPQFYGGVNLISANLTTEIPITDKLTFVAAGRRAYTDVYSSWLADEILAKKTGLSARTQNSDEIDPEFYFNDYNSKITWTPNETENISFSIYGAKDYLDNSYESQKDNISISTNDINKWGNYGMGVSWRKQFNSNFFTNFQMGHSGYYNNYNNNTTYTDSISSPFVVTNTREDDATNERNRLQDYFFTLKNTLFLNQKNKLDFGLSTRYVSFEYYKDDEDDVVYSKLNDDAILVMGFLQNKITLNNKFSIKPGIRLNYYNGTQKVYAEPRLSLSYQLTDNVLLKAATGEYYQFLSKSETEQSYGYSRAFWVLSDGNQNPVEKSQHYIIGTSVTHNKFFFDLEAYYKNINGLQEYVFSSENDNSSNNHSNSSETLSQFLSGKGKAYGIDFLVKYQEANFTSWISYSYSKSIRNFKEINNGDNFPSLFDQPHQFKWTNMYSFKKWNMSSLMIYTSGHPYVEEYENDNNFNVTRTYNRLPNYFRFDLSANYNFKIKEVSIKPGLSILNVFNTKNYIDVYVQNFNFNGSAYKQTTKVKAQEITLNFFVNFRF